jgi:predicted CoA-binding protein
MKNTLVFGASPNPSRYSHLAMKRLVEQGVPTQAFGSKSGQVSGLQIKTNLDNFQNIHTITLYLNPKRQQSYYDDIVQLHPKRVIFNPGTENPEFYAILKKNDIVVEIACTLTLLALGHY